MSTVEIVILVLSIILLLVSCLLEKILRRKIKKSSLDEGEAPSENTGDLSRMKTFRIMASAAAAASAAGVFIILIVSGVSQTLQLGSLLLMLFLVLI